MKDKIKELKKAFLERKEVRYLRDCTEDIRFFITELIIKEDVKIEKELPLEKEFFITNPVSILVYITTKDKGIKTCIKNQDIMYLEVIDDFLKFKEYNGNEICVEDMSDRYLLCVYKQCFLNPKAILINQDLIKVYNLAKRGEFNEDECLNSLIRSPIFKLIKSECEQRELI